MFKRRSSKSKRASKGVKRKHTRKVKSSVNKRRKTKTSRKTRKTRKSSRKGKTSKGGGDFIAYSIQKLMLFPREIPDVPQRLVIAIIGINDKEINQIDMYQGRDRIPEIKTLIENVKSNTQNIIRTDENPLIIFLDGLNSNSYIAKKDFADFIYISTDVYLNNEEVEKPELGDLLKAIYEDERFSEYIGLKVDVAISDLSSAAWYIDDYIKLCDTMKNYIKLNGIMYILNPKTNNQQVPGGKYYQKNLDVYVNKTKGIFKNKKAQCIKMGEGGDYFKTILPNTN